MVPKILQANQTVLAEKLKVFKKARRDASSPVSTRVGRMLFLMENAHCATAGDTEQNGAEHFYSSTARNRNVL